MLNNVFRSLYSFLHQKPDIVVGFRFSAVNIVQLAGLNNVSVDFGCSLQMLIAGLSFGGVLVVLQLKLELGTMTVKLTSI